MQIQLVIHALVKQMEKVTKLVVVYQQLALVNSYWKWIRCVPVLCAANSGCVVNIWVSSCWKCVLFQWLFLFILKADADKGATITCDLQYAYLGMHSIVYDG